MIAPGLCQSPAVQSIAYGLLTGTIGALPGLAIFLFNKASEIWGSPPPGAAVFVQVISLSITVFGAIPAAIAAAATWRLILARDQQDQPEVLRRCWRSTTIGAYLLLPLWLITAALWNECVAGSLDRCLSDAIPIGGMGAVAYMVFGLLFAALLTVPIVLPLTFLAAWLWVRRLRPRLFGGTRLPGVMTSGT